jgi:hypothetical protein
MLATLSRHFLGALFHIHRLLKWSFGKKSKTDFGKRSLVGATSSSSARQKWHPKVAVGVLCSCSDMSGKVLDGALVPDLPSLFTFPFSALWVNYDGAWCGREFRQRFRRSPTRMKVFAQIVVVEITISGRPNGWVAQIVVVETAISGQPSKPIRWRTSQTTLANSTRNQYQTHVGHVKPATFTLLIH